jgi:hypothetical protein
MERHRIYYREGSGASSQYTRTLSNIAKLLTTIRKSKIEYIAT